MNANYKWIEQIDYKKHLDGNSALMVEICGLDKFIDLVEAFAKTQIYFSTEPLIKMKKEYILAFNSKYTAKELARILQVSERFVYKVLRELITT